MSAEAEISPFPTNPDEFNDDERISFSTLDNKYIAVQDDGAEYEFNPELRRWAPIVDESLIQEYQSGYVALDGSNNGSASGGRQESARGGKKRKNDQSNDREQDGYGRSKSGKRQATRQAPQPKQNTAVYVTGLPPDATVDEVKDLFSRKCGVIAEEIDSGRPRIKLYTDADGNFKGDALVVFFKPQSVEMAIMLLDDADFRINPSGTTSGKIRVQAADLSYKKTKYDEGGGGKPADQGAGSAQHGDASVSGGGNGDGAKPANQQRRNNEQEKQKVIKRTQKLDAKLADWDDDEPKAGLPGVAAAAAAAASNSNRWDKVVILSHMFSQQELEEDPAALLDIKDDIREECEKLGAVTNVVLFDGEEEGIVSVKFRTAEAADACVALMHGRSFDGRTVEAYFATGRERFKKSKQKDADGEDEDEDDGKGN